ncbi:MAG: CRISPR-associated protein Cas4 [Microthrixaceae bacterium]
MRLSDWLATLDPASTNRNDTVEDVTAARSMLTEAARSLRVLAGAETGPALPLTISQQFVSSIHRCEQLAVQEAAGGHAGTGWKLFRGRALDAYVCHVIHAGPVADPVEDLRSHWAATDSPGDIEALDAHLSTLDRVADVDPLAVADAVAVADPLAVDERVADLALLASSAGAFGQLRAQSPRVEVTLAVEIEDSVRLPGRVDVLLGGPGTGAPAVLLEVKSGSHRSDHSAQLRHYVMLAALVHGHVPAAAALWYPSGQEAQSPEMCVEVPVGGAVTSSAMRVVAAMERLGELWDGRVPQRTAGPHCNWCSLADVCSESLEQLDAVVTDG